jgi:hypothetical protein
MIGEARYIVDAGDATACEFAVAVANDWQGIGLARILLTRLADHVASSVIRRMSGDTIAAWLRGNALRAVQRLRNSTCNDTIGDAIKNLFFQPALTAAPRRNRLKSRLMRRLPAQKSQSQPLSRKCPIVAYERESSTKQRGTEPCLGLTQSFSICTLFSHQKASRYPSVFSSPVAGTNPHDIAEDSRKMALVGKAAVKRDLADRSIAVGEKVFGNFDSAKYEPAMRCDPDRLAERPPKVRH